jgi:transcriptional regulator
MWYETLPAVPTWNYVAVHAYGVARVIDDPPRMAHLLDQTIHKYESPLPSPWSGELPEEFKSKLMQAIVGFEIPLARIEGKFKLGQNRPAGDASKTCAVLSSSARESDRELAQWMEEARK